MIDSISFVLWWRIHIVQPGLAARHSIHILQQNIMFITGRLGSESILYVTSDVEAHLFDTDPTFFLNADLAQAFSLCADPDSSRDL